jgi:Flp pilus assembly protein TadD
VLASRGELEEAESLAREAVEIAGRTDFLDLRAGVSLDLGEILRMAERPQQARESFAQALALYEQKGNVVGAERAKSLFDELAR